MKPVIHHVTIDGAPLCEAEGHLAGMCGQVIDGVRIVCETHSGANAHRIKKIVQRKRHSVRVVRGPCPVMEAAQS